MYPGPLSLPLGTYRYFMKVFANFGVETTLVDMTDFEALEAAVKKNTKVYWGNDKEEYLLCK